MLAQAVEGGVQELHEINQTPSDVSSSIDGSAYLVRLPKQFGRHKVGLPLTLSIEETKLMWRYELITLTTLWSPS